MRILACLLLVLALPAQSGEQPMSEAHQDMLEAIKASVQQSAGYTGIDSLSPPVMAALASVPREAYVPDSERPYAYVNTPLPIGHGQTISQPVIVGLMTEMLAPAAHHRVLEIGTGSGYQAAVLAQLVAKVFTVEIVPELAQQAAETLKTQAVKNVEVRSGDGYRGWPEAAPFEGIIVTAAPETIPAALVEQLAPGGRMVIPLGPENGFQQLFLLEKLASGKLKEKAVLPVRFVPFTGEAQTED